jgi:hypothetical protein
MITAGDINKLKTVFVTKDYLKKELSNYPTKEDLKNELKNYPTKDDLKKELAVVINEITNVVMTLSEGIQESLDRLKDHDSALKNHERRLDKIEDKVFSSN